MRLFLKTFILSAILPILFSCNRSGNVPAEAIPSTQKESLIKANQHIVQAENEQIDNFIARYGWEMMKTQTGLRYMIYDDASGKRIEKDDKVMLKYAVKLLTGDPVYSSDEDGLLEFVVGKGQTITGMEEAILHLSKGDKARFIIPSYLAYGLVGDGKKISHKATLVYEVEVIEVIDL